MNRTARILLTLLAAPVVGMLAAERADAAPPELTSLYPAGAARRSEIEVTASGTFSHWPPGVWIDRPGVDVKPAEEKGKLSVRVAEDATPGAYWIRLHDAEGGSGLRPFVVGQIPEVVEAEPNDHWKKPQEIEGSSTVVNGRFDRTGDVDVFAVKLAGGQTLVASLTGNQQLGSPLDATLQIVTPRGFILEHNDDSHGLDPQIVFAAPVEGLYLVRSFAFPAKPNSSIRFAGGADYVYRLTLTTGPFLDHAIPLAAPRDADAEVELFGWNLDEAEKRLSVSPEPEAEFAELATPQAANVLRVPRMEHPVPVEAEPNNADAEAQPLALPATLTGRIDAPGDVDVFRLSVAEKTPVTLRVESSDLGYLLDPHLSLADESGKVLKQNDDAGRDQRDASLTHTLLPDASYFVSVRDLKGHGGFRYVYRLTATPVEPDFSLTVGSDRFTVPSGKPLEVPVTVARAGGFAGEIEVSVEGLPPGVTAEAQTSAGEGDTAKSVTLVFNAERAGSGADVRIVGRARASETEVVRTATAALADFGERTRHLWVTPVKPPEKTDNAAKK